MKLNLKTDFLLYTVSLTETSKGNYIKLSTMNSKHDNSIFLFDIVTGKLVLSRIDTKEHSHAEFYKKLANKPNISIGEFIQKCMTNKIMIAYSQKEADVMFADVPPKN